MAYIPVEPIIENTTMEIYVNSAGVQRTYRIYPIEGYVIHVKGRDFELEDGTLVLGYSGFGVSVPITYDFEENPEELYTVLESEVPPDQIFGGNSSETE